MEAAPKLKQRIHPEQINSEAYTADDVRRGVRAMLYLAGEDPDRAGLKRTPQRYLDAWMELTERTGDPESLLATQFDDVGEVDQMITVGPIGFSSVCEHHLLPFSGVAHIAYIPDGFVVGLSKLPRLLEHYARRPQVQERLTGQITQALQTFTRPRGAACLIRAVHTCATLRGVRKQAPMTTTSLTGLLRSDPAARQEFLDATRAQ